MWRRLCRPSCIERPVGNGWRDIHHQLLAAPALGRAIVLPRKLKPSWTQASGKSNRQRLPPGVLEFVALL